MAKAKADIRSLARAHCPTAIKTLAGIMNEHKSGADARIRAATALLERGYGKAAQPHTGEDGEGPIQVEKIIRDMLTNGATNHADDSDAPGIPTTH